MMKTETQKLYKIVCVNSSTSYVIAKSPNEAYTTMLKNTIKEDFYTYGPNQESYEGGYTLKTITLLADNNLDENLYTANLFMSK